MRREQGTPVSYSPGIGFFVGEGGERGRLWANPADKKYRDGEIKNTSQTVFFTLNSSKKQIYSNKAGSGKKRLFPYRW